MKDRQQKSSKEEKSNDEPIRVQLSKKNHLAKKIYSTKTVDPREYYDKTYLKSDITTYSNGINIQNKLSKINLTQNEENNKYDNLSNTDYLQNYLLPRRINLQHQIHDNRGKVITVKGNNKYSSKPNNNSMNYNNRQNKIQSSHKVRELLSNHYTYNKPKTTSILSSPHMLKKNAKIYNTMTYYNNKLDKVDDKYSIDNFNMNTFKYKKKSYKESHSVISYEDKKYIHYQNIDIKLEDLILYDERLNDILLALKNDNKNKYIEIDASNECNEFFMYYIHSSLQNILYLFFKTGSEIIQSSVNLTLFSIIVTYHLSLNKYIFKQVIEKVKNFFVLLKLNLYLYVKQIELYYGESYVSKNNLYFKNFNYYLKVNNLMNLNEKEIISHIHQNCKLITLDLKKIIKLYGDMNNECYTEFLHIFNNLSILSENDFLEFFSSKLYNKSIQNSKNITKKKIDISKLKQNSSKNYPPPSKPPGEVDNSDVISVKSSKSTHYYNTKTFNNNNKLYKLIKEYERTKVDAPFIKTPCTKKYTIVLDIDETLITMEEKDITKNKYIIHFRPGLSWFLNEIKPFCELITFTSASKEYAVPIIQEIEKPKKFFDYYFFREHTVIYGNDFVKDISRIGRDIKKIIIVDNSENNFKLNLDNGIKIAPFYGDKNDNVLYELKNLIFLIYSQNYDDLRVALKDYKNEILQKISRENY
jgi:Dullard-like phosphatase family protein